MPVCQRHGVGVMRWSPIAMGMLAGRYARATAAGPIAGALRGGIYAERVTEAGVAIGNRFAALARERRVRTGAARRAVGKDQPGITAPIIGPKTVAQLEDLLPADEMTLPADVRARPATSWSPPAASSPASSTPRPWMRWKH